MSSPCLHAYHDTNREKQSKRSKQGKVSTSSLHGPDKKPGTTAPALPPPPQSITAQVSDLLKSVCVSQKSRSRSARLEEQKEALSVLLNERYHATATALQECVQNIDPGLRVSDLTVQLVETFTPENIHGLSQALRPLFRTSFTNAFNLE